MENSNYAGFWIRTAAAIIDSILFLLIAAPILTMIYRNGYWDAQGLVVGTWDVIIGYVFPAIATVAFWVFKSATPGKMILKLSIVDRQTGGTPTSRQFIGRYFAYFVSAIPFFIGIFWVGLDKRKQGWHDKLAGTLVVKYHSTEK